MLIRLQRIVCSTLLALGLGGLLAGAVGAQAGSPALVVKVEGIINPVLADYVSRQIDLAEQREAAAIVLVLDTPGGLDTSMRQIIQRILSSRVPIVVYVGPPGARAASAGVYISYAAHIAAMAPNTNIGSATPVAMGEGGESKMSDEMRAKVNNDAVAYIRSLAERRARNREWAERAVREGVNVPASEAVQQQIVDLSASDVRSLLQQIDGRTVDMVDGPRVLSTASAPIENVEMGALERFLHRLSDPTIAYLLLSLGSLGLMLELYNPGQVIPGIVGGICLLLAFYALGTLPVNYAGLLLIGFAILLFVADVMTPTHGALTIGGTLAFVLGSVLLFNAPDSAPFLRVSLPIILAVAAIFASFFLVVVAAVLRTRRRRVVTGREGLLGGIGVVRARLAPEGLVHVEGELWRARSAGRAVEPGERVRVAAMHGLLLDVEPLAESAPLPAAALERPASTKAAALAPER
jgi:membrane-bound serine protease (ClpP class)